MIAEDINSFKKISEEVQELFSGLIPAQLTAKENADSWSIGQCLDHLIVSNSKYFPVLESLKSPKFRMSFWERNNPFTKSTGQQMLKNLGPIVTKKYKAPKIFLPSKNSSKPTVVNDFLEHQKKMISIIEKITPEQYSKCTITSPVAGLITLKVSDAIQILIAHEQRHLEQMKRILKSIQ